MNNPKLLYRIPEKTNCPYTLIVTANNLNRPHILAKFLAELTDKAGLDPDSIADSDASAVSNGGK